MHTRRQCAQLDCAVQVKNGVLAEVLAAVAYFQPGQVLIEQVNEAQCTDGGIYAAELQGTFMHLGYQVRTLCGRVVRTLRFLLHGSRIVCGPAVQNKSSTPRNLAEPRAPRRSAVVWHAPVSPAPHLPGGAAGRAAACHAQAGYAVRDKRCLPSSRRLDNAGCQFQRPVDIRGASCDGTGGCAAAHRGVDDERSVPRRAHRSATRERGGVARPALGLEPSAGSALLHPAGAHPLALFASVKLRVTTRGGAALSRRMTCAP